MLDHEYGLMIERLASKRGDNTKFFSFADTVAAQSFTRREDWHGWMGVRFQSEPRGEPSQIIMHVRMWDKENLQQQEALGVLGVNLIHGALYHHDDVNKFLSSLLDDLSEDRVEVDMIKFSGPAFKGVDNRLVTLKLVQDGLTNAAMFTADGEVVQAAEVLYKKPILVERGSFRPVTNVTLDRLRNAQAQFIQEPGEQGEEVVTLMEMTLKNLTDAGEINHQDFLDRVDILGTLGKGVLISNYGAYFRLAGYLFRYTKKNIGIVMGVPSLREIFEEKYYADPSDGSSKMICGFMSIRCRTRRRARSSRRGTSVSRRTFSTSMPICWRTITSSRSSTIARSICRFSRATCWARSKAAARNGRTWCRHKSRKLSRSASCSVTRARRKRTQHWRRGSRSADFPVRSGPRYGEASSRVAAGWKARAPCFTRSRIPRPSRSSA